MATQQIQQAPGIKRTDLQQHDLSIPGREVIQNRVDFGPDAPYVWHKHPGEEVIYVLEGTLEYAIDGRPAQAYSAGEALTVPAETPTRSEMSAPVARGARHVHRREGQALPGGAGGRRMSAAKSAHVRGRFHVNTDH